MDLEKIHTCEKSKGKIVCIETNNMGLTFCGYCHERVDYNIVTLEIPAKVRPKTYAATITFSYSDYLELETSFFQMTVAYDLMKEKMSMLHQKFVEGK